MSRILLADDSPHAQRMGERILREEGFEVVSLTDGGAVLARLADVDPDVIVADVFLPGKSGFELCRYVKSEPSFKHVRVVLTAGLLEPFDETEAKRSGCDAIIKKPFEGSRVIGTIAPLVKDAQEARGQPVEPMASATPPAAEPAPVPSVDPPRDGEPLGAGEPPKTPPPPAPEPAKPPAPEIDAERVRAAVTLALDAALPAMIQEITERVLIVLGH
jgi:CheY-like chemotaxis protein